MVKKPVNPKKYWKKRVKSLKMQKPMRKHGTYAWTVVHRFENMKTHENTKKMLY